MLTVVPECRHLNLFHRCCPQLLRIAARRVTYKSRKKYRKLQLRKEEKEIFKIWEKETTAIFGPVVGSRSPPEDSNSTSVLSYRQSPSASQFPARHSNIHYAPSKIDGYSKGGSTLQEVARASNLSTATSPKNTLIQKLDPILTYPFFASDSSNSTIGNIDSVGPTPELNLEELVKGLSPRLAMPSVSKVIETSRSPEEQAVLDRWKQKMIMELGEEGFQQWQKGTL